MSEENLAHSRKTPDGSRYLWYFMEERHPEMGNLSPRDVVAREMFFVNREFSGQVYLDMTHLSAETWKKKLPDLREEIIHYQKIDPRNELVPVEPGIHYFMGGIDVDVNHRTNIDGLFAAGECCSQYHGANRLGGNSMLGAIYGGKIAAEFIAQRDIVLITDKEDGAELKINEDRTEAAGFSTDNIFRSDALSIEIRDILLGAMGIIRNESSLKQAQAGIDEIIQNRDLSPLDKKRAILAKSMLLSAGFRKESRGAHYREDYPASDEKFKGMVTVLYENGTIKTGFRPVEENRGGIPLTR